MDPNGAYPFYYPEVMTYTTGNPDASVSPPTQVQPNAVVRKNSKWNDLEHKVFVSAADVVIAEGQRSGKCFTQKGWDRIRYIFNSQTGHDWSINQLKNHWHVMHNDHKLFQELNRCTGVEYGYNTDNKIHASDAWWDCKIKENPKYKNFRDQDCSEYYKTYARLFGDTCDSTRFAFTPTKLAQRGFGLGPDSDSESPKDTIPVNDEGTDSSDGPTLNRNHSSMDVSASRSGSKHKGSTSKRKGKEKEKKKKLTARELSASVETLASMGTNLESISLARDKLKDTISVDHCVEELMSTGLIEEGDDVHMFALSFLTKADNRKGFQAARTPEMKVKWINWCFNDYITRRSTRR